MKKLALALLTAAPLAFAGTASAKDMKGRFGVGGQLGENIADVPLGLSLKYWVSDLGFQALLGLKIDGDPDGDGPSESLTHLGLGLRVLFNFARANDTNMYAGLGARFALIDTEVEKDPSVHEKAIFIDLLIGVEHYFTDFFSVAGHVGLNVDVAGEATDIRLGDAAMWGTSFHFYF